MNKQKMQTEINTAVYSAQIQRTSFNVPHITAKNLPSAWFGQGYAMAEDRACVLLDQVIKIRSQRSRLFGAGEGDANIETDFAYKHLGLLAAAEQDLAVLPVNIQEMLTAHAAGINQFLNDKGIAGLPLSCRNAKWLLNVTPADLLAITTDFSIFLSGRFLTPLLSNATPPGNSANHNQQSLHALDPAFSKKMLGSNGWGIGGDLTASGNGMLLAQPHFPWEGALQAWESHVTVPGELDVYGITVPGIPNTLVGFNPAIAWTLTVTTSPKATLYELTLVPGQPTQYKYDGKVRSMQANEYSIEVLTEAGQIEKKTRTLWRSHYGPMLSIPAMFTGGLADYTWNGGHAISYRDANIDNRTLLSQFLDMSKAHDLNSFIEAHRRWAGSIPFSNTIATSMEGSAWFADSSPAPNISPTSFQAWKQSLKSDPGKAALSSLHGIYVLDGSTSRDEWVNDPAARKPGLIPFALAPQQVRKDFVFNANDSYWLTNPKKPLEGFNPLFGAERTSRSLRTRMNALELLKGNAEHKFSLATVQTAALSNKSLTGALLRKELVKRCKSNPIVSIENEQIDLSQACNILAEWDEKFDLDSKGAVLFREFLGCFEAEASGHGHSVTSAEDRIFAQPFDPNEPILTPTGLAPATSTGADVILLALGKAVQELTLAGFALDTPLRELQFSKKNDKRIPIHGGQGAEGIMNMAAYSGSNGTLLPSVSSGKVINPSTGLTNEGYLVNYGTSFLLAVELTPKGPNCQAILSFSQSDDPDSGFFSDQTQLYSNKSWRPCHFTQSAIKADSALRTYQVMNTK